MIAFPGCKINLGLRILNKRADGFHNLETIFYPLPLREAVEVIRNNDGTDKPVHFTSSGNTIDGNVEDNLCVKAYLLLKKDFPSLPSVKIHLHKTLPMGAGLGGGSADAAFTLKLLNNKFQLGITTEALMKYSLQLGSDCPFFILDKPCYATGRGEILDPIELPLNRYQLILVNPGIHVNTGQAFTKLNRSTSPVQTGLSLKEIITQDISTWQQALVNDFEAPVFNQHPELNQIKIDLYEKGALYAAMSGSGSSLFGLFEKNSQPVFKFPQHYFIKTLYL